ncbi:hypothetical protein TanjilG_22476 [Lupinus angustifolius]|uniref:Pentatricopeptide repeat-containing protein n=1 Tax=Lupinus angustifolius TaxID=3871 RepID=A0A4P1RS01_LUPAN|nr:hypothetical protein TanjilG_22476 [Lupinus angustifolius]
MLTTALDKDNIFISQLIHTSASLGFSSFSYSLFTYNHRPNIFLYNNTIWALSKFNAPRAILLFKGIRLLGLKPDNYSFPFVLKAVVHLLDDVVGRQIHCQAVSCGLDLDCSVVTSLVQMYCSCLHVSYARKLFDEITSKRVSLWNAMIAGYAKLGDMANARSLFDCMPEKDKDVVSWTAVISGYTQADNPNQAIALFHRMQLHNVNPDEIAILAVLSACADLGALELGEWIHNYIEKHKLHKIVPLCNSLIDMWSESRIVRKDMRNAGVEKKPGVSFIEVNNRVYEFIAGDKLDVSCVGTFDVLHSINEQLKMVCPKTAHRGPLDVDD